MPINQPTAGEAAPEHVSLNDQVASLRANLYQFLAGVFLSSPNRTLVDQFQAIDFINQTALFLGEDVVAPLRDITGPFDSDESLATLQQEYMDLFIVPTGRYVTPFEDVYRGMRLDGKQERGPLLGDRAVTVKVFYRNAGADMDTGCKELPTHIGVELSFMSYLCEQQQQALLKPTQQDSNNEFSETDVYRLWQLKFLHEHLTDWFPQLNKTIQGNAKTPFYRGLAQFTENFLNKDKEQLQKQLEFDLQPTSPERETV